MRIEFRKILLITLIIFSLLTINCANNNIQPVGKQISVDKMCNAIYQISANGIKIGYKLIGQGQPLLLIMGLGWTMDKWSPALIDELAQNYQLIIPDNRGRGFTSADEKDFNFELFANDFLALLAVLQVKKTNILSYSMGGTITQQLLLQAPDKINKAIIIATTIDGSLLPNDLKDKMPAEPIIQQQISASKKWKTPLEKLPAIKNEILLIVGSEDNIVGMESSEILKDNLPNARLQIFENASHLLMYEYTEQLTESVLDFLKQKK